MALRSLQDKQADVMALSSALSQSSLVKPRGSRAGHVGGIFHRLVGGLEHLLFSHILGIIIPIDFHIFQRGGPTTNQIEIPPVFQGGKRKTHHDFRWFSPVKLGDFPASHVSHMTQRSPRRGLDQTLRNWTTPQMGLSINGSIPRMGGLIHGKSYINAW